MAKRGRPKHPDVLTPREYDVLELLRRGRSNEEIAGRLGISFGTAKYHVSEIIGKLGVADRHGAAAWRPDAPAAPRTGGRFWLLAPLALFHRGSAGAGAGARIAAGGVLAVTLAGVALLAFGVFRTTGDRAAAPDPAAAARPAGAGESASEAGIVPWQTYRISGGDLPHPITIPFTEYMLATGCCGRSPDGAPAPAPSAGAASYRLEFVRADDGATPFGSAGAYAPGATPLFQAPSIGAPADPQSWQQAPPVDAALLDRYIALGRAGALPDRPTLVQSIAAAQNTGPTSVTVSGRALPASESAVFLSLFGATSPVRFGLRASGVGQRALQTATVDVRLGAETLTFSYIPAGPVASYGLLMATEHAGNWEFSTLLDPPAYAQFAYSVPKELDDLMTRLGFGSDARTENADTRIMPLLDADMTMRIERVTLSDGTHDVSVDGVDPDRTDCAPGVDVCDPEAAALPTDALPLTLTVSRRGIDPFPEAQRPAEYSYYPPAIAGARGVLVQTKAGAIWNATLGRDGGTPYYASGATDDALRAAVRQLAGQPPEARATLTPRTVLVAFNEEGTTMSVLDPSSGRSLGTVPVGYSSWAIVRASAQEVLVSQAFGIGADNAPTLRVYGLRDLTTQVATLPMPDRTVGIVDYPFMLLSLGECYLYYAKNRSLCLRVSHARRRGRTRRVHIGTHRALG